MPPRLCAISDGLQFEPFDLLFSQLSSFLDYLPDYFKNLLQGSCLLFHGVYKISIIIFTVRSKQNPFLFVRKSVGQVFYYC